MTEFAGFFQGKIHQIFNITELKKKNTVQEVNIFIDCACLKSTFE